MAVTPSDLARHHVDRAITIAAITGAAIALLLAATVVIGANHGLLLGAVFGWTASVVGLGVVYRRDNRDVARRDPDASDPP